MDQRKTASQQAGSQSWKTSVDSSCNGNYRDGPLQLQYTKQICCFRAFLIRLGGAMQKRPVPIRSKSSQEYLSISCRFLELWQCGAVAPFSKMLRVSPVPQRQKEKGKQFAEPRIVQKRRRKNIFISSTCARWNATPSRPSMTIDLHRNFRKKMFFFFFFFISCVE